MAYHKKIIIKLFSFFILITMAYSLVGCAYSYTDNSGIKHVVGLVNLKIKTSPQTGTYAGQITDIRSIGISVNNSDTGGSFSIGYNRELSGYLKDHVLVIGNPLDFTDDIYGQDTK